MKRLIKQTGSPALFQCCKMTLVTVTAFAVMIGSAAANTVYVTVVDDGSSNIGAPGTLYNAITNCNPGDTIAFNINTNTYGPGPYHFFGPPPTSPPLGGGLPLIYRKSNLLIDGYTQPGSSPNTNPINAPNNAVIKIIIDGSNNGSRGMDSSSWDGTLAASDPPINNTFMASEQTGYGNTERALLGIYRSTNVWIRGIAFLGSFSDPNGDQKLICLEHDYDGDTSTNYTQADWDNGMAYQSGSDANCHISGCWFGVDPGNPTVAGVKGSDVAIAFYRHRDVNGDSGPRPSLPNVGLIIGVAPGSANPRAEFNVFDGFGYCMDGENVRTRVSGNFFGIMPDGVTPYNITLLNDPAFDGGMIEFGRYSDTQPIIVGTDGDGVNDADEGNYFGPLELEGGPGGQVAHVFDNYSTGRKPFIYAGNHFGVDVNGTPFTQCAYSIGSVDMSAGTQTRFGSDFNGVSDAFEANVLYNNHVFATEYTNALAANAQSLWASGAMGDPPGSTTDAWISCRGNVMVNNWPEFNPDDASGVYFTFWWSNYVAETTYPMATIPDPAIPTLSGASTVSSISGSFLPPNNGYNTVVVDLYVVDPEGLANGAYFSNPNFGGDFINSPKGWGFPQGKTYLGSYIVPNPASGTFTWNSPPGVTNGMDITYSLTYSTFAQPVITSITPASGSTAILTWTGDNGGPYQNPGAGTGPNPSQGGGPASGFGVQSSPTVVPWVPTTTYAAGNSATVAAPGFYRIVAPINGMTTLFAKPVTLP